MKIERSFQFQKEKHHCRNYSEIKWINCNIYGTNGQTKIKFVVNIADNSQLEISGQEEIESQCNHCRCVPSSCNNLTSCEKCFLGGKELIILVLVDLTDRGKYIYQDSETIPRQRIENWKLFPPKFYPILHFLIGFYYCVHKILDLNVLEGFLYQTSVC